MIEKIGVCLLSIVPLRLDPCHSSAMVSQLLFGETFEIIEEINNWYKIQTSYDQVNAWVEKIQTTLISAENYQDLSKIEEKFSAEIVAYVSNPKHILTIIPPGASVSVLDIDAINFEKMIFDGLPFKASNQKNNLINTALQYLNAPYLKGGKTPFGIDASGFVQMVYKINGFYLPRTVESQSKLGDSLSFIEESEPGDLAFFDDEDGNINHVGIMLTDNYILHAYGKVRIDRLDHLGIFNEFLNKHTHQLRIIKQVVRAK